MVSNASAVVENAIFLLRALYLRMKFPTGFIHIEIYTASRGFLAIARLLSNRNLLATYSTPANKHIVMKQTINRVSRQTCMQSADRSCSAHTETKYWNSQLRFIIQSPPHTLHGDVFIARRRHAMPSSAGASISSRTWSGPLPIFPFLPYPGPLPSLFPTSPPPFSLLSSLLPSFHSPPRNRGSGGAL